MITVTPGRAGLALFADDAGDLARRARESRQRDGE
jgi:hypothetical protein